MENKNPMGRPTKYKPEYCEKIIEFFNIDHTHFETITSTDKKGNITSYEKEVPNRLPTFERFCVQVCDVDRDTLLQWCKDQPDFSVAYKKAKEYQKDMLIDLAMRGFYNPTFTIFTAKNITDMSDRVDITSGGEKIESTSLLVSAQSIANKVNGKKTDDSSK